MTITAIREYDKRKVLVQLDEHLELPLYKSEVNKYHLKQREELSIETYSELICILSKRAKLRAMNLLQKRSYTREGLRRKLVEGRYPKELVEDALDYVTSYHYIDDMRYAEEYIRCYCENRSKRRILQDLFSKGVSSDVAEAAWERHEALNAPVDEIGQIKELLRKRHFDSETADRKETAKVMNYLYRKGYNIDSIRQCIRFDEN